MAALVAGVSPPPPAKEEVVSESPPHTNGMTEVACAQESVMDTASLPILSAAAPRKQPGKFAFVNPTEAEEAELYEQVQLRITEGQGEAFLDIGVGDGSASGSGLSEEELAHSLATLERIAGKCSADLTVLRRRVLDGGLVAECLVRVRMGQDDFMEIRVAVVGNVDAGKSTLLGVLTHAELDNGRGTARQKLFRHKHEMESGRTSSVGNDILGYDSKGAVMNKPDGRGVLDWEKLCRDSSKVVTFIDLAGHERYLKTTIFGMTGHSPDFCMLMVGANAGIIGITKG